MNVVVVESPAKAKTINRYLGDDYTVVASYGHVRDLPAKDGSVKPDEQFAMAWSVEDKSKKHIDAIIKALRGAKQLILATDPDREGEAISWHVREVLNERDALQGIDVKRVVFNEITRGAILDAFAHPRDLHKELVEAYLARRALDYLVGFTLSPVLWRKLPGSRSAGRVQSVALRLICEREDEIEAFRPREYWTVKALLLTGAGDRVSAHLTHLDGAKLDKFDLPDEAAAQRAVAAIEAREFFVDRIERKQVRRQPAPPFITSTLQQEASRKLSFSAKHTMRVAQRLYEGVSVGGETVGLITYMRTDGVTMAADAVNACRHQIEHDYGPTYVPPKPRMYKSKVKNAQEAHEAIRPTDISRRPEDVAGDLDRDQLKLYTLIWKRTLASQMEAAVLDQVAVDFTAPDRQVTLRATGSVVAFDGFLRVYREDRDDPEQSDATEDESERLLPDLKTGEEVNRDRVTPEQHFTQPPPRYTEASLVKRLEELGIGRPSTYATIISVLQDRNYVRLEKRRFMPEDRGRLVTAFLTSFFDRYVAYGFTAEMESRLDDISGGRIDWKAVLEDFWKDFSAAVGETKDLRVKEVLEALDRLLGPHFFGETLGDVDPRVCPSCKEGRLALKLGKFGAFIGCSNYPECRYTRPLVPVRAEDAAETNLDENGDRPLGDDPATGLPVVLRKGPYGYYLQLGAKANGADEAKPKRATLPPGQDPQQLDLEQALALLALPRTVGVHPETGLAITAGIGRFGPYLKHGDRYLSLKGKDHTDTVLTIGLNRAVDLLAAPVKPPPGSKTLATHPDDGKPITTRRGRFGAYIQHGASRVSLPEGTTAEDLSVDDLVALLASKAGKKAGAKGKATTKTKPKAKGTGKTASSTAKAADGAKTSSTAKVAGGAKTKQGEEGKARTARTGRQSSGDEAKAD